MGDPVTFLTRPGLPGAFGGLMDEYARAAEDFCRVVEKLRPEAFERQVESKDPNTRSIRAICAHALGAAHRYADYIRKARGMPFVERYELPAAELAGPAGVRPRLAEMLHYTEGAIDGLHEADEKTVAALTFPVRWGPIYDPEMILEHGIVHLLRHRRQIERWTASS
jgi:hypothetical protein